MTKTEYISQGVDELRASLLELFEDEDGAIAQANKKQLVDFAKDNWDYIDSVINPVEEPDAETQEDEQEEEVVEEAQAEELLDEEPDLSKPNPKTDLYTGRLG